MLDDNSMAASFLYVGFVLLINVQYFVLFMRNIFSGTDRHLNAIVYGYRNDIAVFMRSIRIFPMTFADREQFTNAIVSAVNNAKLSLLKFHFFFYSKIRPGFIFDLLQLLCLITCCLLLIFCFH